MARKRPPEAPAESKPKTRGKPVPTGSSQPSAPTAPPPAPKRNRRASVPPPLAPQLAGPDAEDFLLTDEQKAELARWEQSEYATIMERRAKVARYKAQKLSYREIATRLGMTEGHVKVTAHRIRRRLAALIRDAVLQTVDNAAAWEDELRHLISLFRR